MTSNAFHGMNIEVITGQVAPGLTTQAGQIRDVISAVEHLVTQALENWRGPDSQQFAEKWHQEYRTPLSQLQSDLETLANLARQNASKQEVTSSGL